MNTQAARLIYDTFKHDPNQVKWICYDSSCKLHAHVQFQMKKLRANPNYANCSEAVQWIHANISDKNYFTDLFHIGPDGKGHPHEECYPPFKPADEGGGVNPKCLHHPNLPHFEPIKGCNTEIQETVSKFINRFKYVTRGMSSEKAYFVLLQATIVRNESVIRDISNKLRVASDATLRPANRTGRDDEEADNDEITTTGGGTTDTEEVRGEDDDGMEDADVERVGEGFIGPEVQAQPEPEAEEEHRAPLTAAHIISSWYHRPPRRRKGCGRPRHEPAARR